MTRKCSLLEVMLYKRCAWGGVLYNVGFANFIVSLKG